MSQVWSERAREGREVSKVGLTAAYTRNDARSSATLSSQQRAGGECGSERCLMSSSSATCLCMEGQPNWL